MSLMERKEIKEENIEYINSLLGKLGIFIQEEDGRYYINVSSEKYFTATKRNAGRKPKPIHDKDGYLYRGLTLEAIYKKMEYMTAEEIAKELGISRRTLFRRIRLSKELESEELL